MFIKVEPHTKEAHPEDENDLLWLEVVEGESWLGRYLSNSPFHNDLSMWVVSDEYPDICGGSSGWSFYGSEADVFKEICDFLS